LVPVRARKIALTSTAPELVAGQMDVAAVLDEGLPGTDRAARAAQSIGLVDRERALAHRDEHRARMRVPAKQPAAVDRDRRHQHRARTFRPDHDPGAIGIDPRSDRPPVTAR
jgi:hypothetical protein